MTSWFYSMHWLLRLRAPLMSTIHQAKFATIGLVKTEGRVQEYIQDLNDPEFWKAIYQLLRAAFPALCALRYADSGKPSLDKIHMICNRLTLALNASKEPLSNQVLFPGQVDVGLEQEMTIAEEEEDDEDEMEFEERFVLILSFKYYLFL